MKKTGITTIAIALIAGGASIATAHPQNPGRQQRRHPGKQQQQFRQCPACGMQSQKSRQQAFLARSARARWQQLTPRQRQMLRKKFLQSQGDTQFRGRPQGRRPNGNLARNRQFAQGQSFQGKPQQRGFAGKPGARQLTPEQRRHIAQMHQKFQRQVRQYLATSGKKGHGKPKAACPKKKPHPANAKQKKAHQKKSPHKKPHKPAQTNNE